MLQSLKYLAWAYWQETPSNFTALVSNFLRLGSICHSEQKANTQLAHLLTRFGLTILEVSLTF